MARHHSRVAREQTPRQAVLHEPVQKASLGEMLEEGVRPITPARI